MSSHAAKANIISSMVLSGSISKGNWLPYSSDAYLLESFIIALAYHRFKDIIKVIWKPPPINWLS